MTPRDELRQWRPIETAPRDGTEFGTLRAWAEELGQNESVELLQETLEEEEATDEALTEIAKSAINQQAEAA